MRATTSILAVLFSSMLGQLQPTQAGITLYGDHAILPAGGEPGNLEILGMLSVSGDSIDLGTTVISMVNHPGAIWSYGEASSKPVITTDAILADATYRWGEDAGASRVDKMVLKENNTLEVLAQGYSVSTPNDGAIRLIPGLAAGAGSSIMVNGQRVLTLADTGLFVTQSAGQVSGNLNVGESLTSKGGVIKLDDSPWGGMDAWGIALGTDTLASRNGGIAMGANAKAYGPYSIALGTGAQAHAFTAVSIGHNTIASAHFSFAAGRQTHTWAQGQFVVGANNKMDPDPGDSSDFRLTEAAFVVGNGSEYLPTLLPNPPKSNAFLVRYNGNAEVSGDTIMKKSASVQDDLTVGGDITADKATFTGRVRIEPQGGISMGEFTYDPEQ